MKKIIGIVIASMMFCSSAFSVTSPIKWKKTERDISYYLKRDIQ